MTTVGLRFAPVIANFQKCAGQNPVSRVDVHGTFSQWCILIHSNRHIEPSCTALDVFDEEALLDDAVETV